MNIFYHISPYPTLLENMVAKIYEASSPLAEVQSFTLYERNGAGVITPGAGHQIPVSVSFNGCDMVTHVVRLFTTSGTLLHEYDVQPTLDLVTLFDPIYFRVGDGGTYTPATDSTIINNPLFSGLTAAQISINQEGLGFLLPGIDYTISGSILSLVSSTFDDGQRWYIFRKPSVVTTPVNDSVVGKGFGGFINVTADIDYIPSHLRKLIRFSGVGNYTFPAGSYPIGYTHSFNNFGTIGSTPQINFNNATLLWDGTPKSSIIIPFGSTFAVTFDGTNWNCILNDIKVTASSTPVAGDVIGMGNYVVGDVSALAPDTFITVTHGLGISGNYKVFGTLKGTFASRYHDNNVSWSAYDYTANDFKIGLQEWASGIQNIGFDYILVKS